MSANSGTTPIPIPINPTPTNTNKLRSTVIYGTLSNVDKTDGSIQASASFQRNVNISGNLTLGKETIDASDNANNTGGNIQFSLNTKYEEKPIQLIKNIFANVHLLL